MNGGLDHFGEGKPAESPVGLGEPGNRAGNAGREMASHAGVHTRRAIHVAARPPGSRLPVVQGLHLSVAHPDDHEPAASDIPGLGVHHRECESDRHGRIDCAASAPQNVAAHVAGYRAARDHHGSGSVDHSRLAGVRPGRGDARQRARRHRRARGAAGQQGRGGQQGDRERAHIGSDRNGELLRTSQCS
jgi:hypothetical protein